MKTIVKVFGGFCAIIGWTFMLSMALIAIVEGPKNFWKWVKESFYFGYNYRF